MLFRYATVEFFSIMSICQMFEGINVVGTLLEINNIRVSEKERERERGREARESRGERMRSFVGKGVSDTHLVVIVTVPFLNQRGQKRWGQKESEKKSLES